MKGKTLSALGILIAATGVILAVFFTNITLSQVFGLLIAGSALWQFFLLAIGLRPHQLPGWLYIFPLLLAGAAIYVFAQKHASENTIMLITGISLAVMGVGCVFEGSFLGVERRRVIKEASAAQAQTAAEIDKKEERKPEAPKPAFDPNETTDDLDAPLKIDPKSAN